MGGAGCCCSCCYAVVVLSAAAAAAAAAAADDDDDAAATAVSTPAGEDKGAGAGRLVEQQVAPLRQRGGTVKAQQGQAEGGAPMAVSGAGPGREWGGPAHRLCAVVTQATCAAGGGGGPCPAPLPKACTAARQPGQATHARTRTHTCTHACSHSGRQAGTCSSQMLKCRCWPEPAAPGSSFGRKEATSPCLAATAATPSRLNRRASAAASASAGAVATSNWPGPA